MATAQLGFGFYAQAADPEGPEASVNPADYDDVIVMFSGGKDSVACALHMIELGLRPELWHHDVDGRAGGAASRFDWPVTTSYCRRFAEHLGLPFHLSWRDGGLAGELLKQGERTKPVIYETPDEGLKQAGGTRGSISTRRRWPALSANLASRWCSPVAKIDVGAAAIAGQRRFDGRRVLVMTGERAQESSARARYAQSEPHRTHAPKRRKRHVTHWRPIHSWTEKEVWSIIERHGIVPHPCYRLGFGRASCFTCIFSSPNQAATIAAIAPERMAWIDHHEKDFGHTIRQGERFVDYAAKGRCHHLDPHALKDAMSEIYEGPIWTDRWTLPQGAYGEQAGPN